MAILELLKVKKVFGGLTAVNDLDLKLEQGELLGLIGPNGAGKTTTFNTITGVLPATSGKIIFEGKEITRLKPYEIARKGLIRTFQLNTLFNDLTVLQNVFIGGHASTGLGTGFLDSFFPAKERKANEQKALDVLSLLNLTYLKDELAKNLPHGLQRSLEIAIALISNPKLLLLDEPVAGMNWDEATKAMEMINELRRKEKISVLLVEHNMKIVMSYCDRIAVMNFGKKIAEGTPSKIRQDKEVIAAYLGE
jgi:branched-chain amino acid transport system ATP-binding protein